MLIYIDNDFKCHVSDDGTMMEIETDYFDGKCAEYIEGYRFIPEGKCWQREDGVVFSGEMVAPWKDIRDLRLAQLEYESRMTQDQLTAYEAAYQEGVVDGWA